MSQLSLIPMSAPPGGQLDLMSGGGLEGAQRMSREMFSWQPALVSPAAQIELDKELADLRAQDASQNQGMVSGAMTIHKDSIVGSCYRLNAKPNVQVLRSDSGWSEEFQKTVEPLFNMIADSPNNWLDASRTNTLTGLVRMSIGQGFTHGEALATAEWIVDRLRPCSTAIQMVSPYRLSNPQGQADTATRKSGIDFGMFGEADTYHIRVGHPGDHTLTMDQWDWKAVKARKPWGRPQVIHIFEQGAPSQPRGIAAMVAAMKDMHMGKRFREITLQNAVINASYAATIESELPAELLYGQLGADASTQFDNLLGAYLGNIRTYMSGANNVSVDGSKIPTLLPGTTLKMQPMGTPGGIGTDFEASLLRHVAAALGLSYEQFSRDYTKTNYSSARASMAETWKFMQSRKKMFADRLATTIYSLWLEEQVAKGDVPLPLGMKADDFYNPIYREALCCCNWIGASRGQIDEKKETEAAVLRIKNNLSTEEEEGARLGTDWRETYAQRQREEKYKQSLGLPNLLDGTAQALEQNKQAAEAANKPTGKKAEDENDDDEESSQ